jgi:DNA-binding CsgD family transcriptional regulator
MRPVFIIFRSEMPDKNINTDFDILKNKVQSFFDEDHEKIKFMVAPEKQQKEISLLQEMAGSGRFFFEVDLPGFELKNAHGIQRWLGYPEKEFSLKLYWNHLSHPSRKQSLLLLAQQLYETLCKGVYPLEFMVQRFSSWVPLKHYNGHYVLAQKTSSVFQYDNRNRLTSYLNEFTIIGDYQGEPMNPRMYNSYGERETVKEKEIMEKTIARFLGMKIFTASELQAIRKLAYHPQITQAEIARDLDRSIHTIDTYYKRFLSKAREFYKQDFASVSDAAQHLRKEGLL